MLRLISDTGEQLEDVSSIVLGRRCLAMGAGFVGVGVKKRLSVKEKGAIRMSWKQWLVGQASRAIVPDESCDLSLNIGPLPARETALPLPRSSYREISPAASTDTHRGFFVESPIP
jgi:hypothetical protein